MTTGSSAARRSLLQGAAMMTLLTSTGVFLIHIVLLPLAGSSWPLANGPRPRLEDVITGLLVWASVGTTAWLTLGTLLAALALVPGVAGRGAGRCVDALTPALLRRLLAFLLGTGLGTVSLPSGPATGAASAVTIAQVQAGPNDRATTDGSSSPDPGFAPSPAATIPVVASPRRTSPDPLSPRFAPTRGTAAERMAPSDPRWRPSRPVRVTDTGATGLLVPTPRAAHFPDDVVTVRQGDSLWSLAARQLGRDASDRQIALAWPEWYALNVQVIGPDPDLIHPGQQLRIPTLGEHR
ncbi:MAG: LysM peptidoglycan-binding domain-containing protein [Intrasporangium sp.]|uniref:LysM peptidoglycan-binding domain-containing protein n=1 Tax=Intrasporangium sp. TaxID=1925024 RepID=UPI002649E9AB|nr:LysM peptidoglycan-binding domain-containing protein [Intrasporangium sp.]MDN5795573.1 LysM peptidoglycan-binding domain-containing protein [Intrasporangium sp.]